VRWQKRPESRLPRSLKSKHSLAHQRRDQVLSTVWQAKLDLARIEHTLSEMTGKIEANRSKLESIRDDITKYLAVRR
jgi:septal ring factor EnvC (AmiA/AmiB activator)